MSDVAMTTAAEPDGAPRIAVLDILRGIAILGILFMNINDMGQSMRASFFDIRHLGWSASDQIAWWIREVFANGTARCLLELLFGAGMVILTDRAAQIAGRWNVLRRYAVRNIVLFLFGLVHIFVLLWPGDILHTYGIAAIIAVLFRTLRPRLLITLGLIAAAFLFVNGLMGYYADTQQRSQIAAITSKRASHTPLAAADRKVLADAADEAKTRAKFVQTMKTGTVAEDKARKGTFSTWMHAQWSSILEMEAIGLEIIWVIEAVTVMLIGAGLFKLGVLQGDQSRGFYWTLTLLGYAIGISCRVAEAYATTRFDQAPDVMAGTYEIARLAMTFGHIGAIHLLLGTSIGQALLRPFVAAGRTALSIYIAQTLICLWVLYPPFGLGLYGTMTWGPLMLTALAIDAVLLVGANLWMRHFDIAPVEWAWRSLLERRALPWRKRGRRGGGAVRAERPALA